MLVTEVADSLGYCPKAEKKQTIQLATFVCLGKRRIRPRNHYRVSLYENIAKELDRKYAPSYTVVSKSGPTWPGLSQTSKTCSSHWRMSSDSSSYHQSPARMKILGLVHTKQSRVICTFFYSLYFPRFRFYLLNNSFCTHVY